MQTYTAFARSRQIATGSVKDVLPVLKRRFDRDSSDMPLVFEDDTGRQIDFDLRGSLTEVIERATAPEPRGPGRPKLGVISREVSLLPRHWQWLEQQPAGISTTLRLLVEKASKANPKKQKALQARDALSRFLTATAGDLPGFEEATRALFSGDHARFEELMESWPKDIRAYAGRAIRQAR